MGRSAAVAQAEKRHASHPIWQEGFEHDPRWQIAQRVASSQHFVRSRLLSSFLLYIVAETLTDRKNEITEHQIGVQVFGRPIHYRSVEDNIVRTYARQLRRRLAEYFSGEGASETLRIDIPLGGYIPVFLPVGETGAPKSDSGGQSAAPPVAIQDGSGSVQGLDAIASPPRWERWKRPFLLTFSFSAYSVLLVWIAWSAAIRFRAPIPVSQSNEPTHTLWNALFAGPGLCYIVPADAGFNLLEDLSRRPLLLADYVKGTYLSVPLPQMDGHSADDLRAQQFTSFVDLQTVTALARLPEFNPQRAILRFPRDLQLDDLKNANAVILGSMGSNPWAALAESKANFRIVSSQSMQGAKIINVNPQGAEASSYVSRWSEPAHQTYAIIAFLPNLGGNGHVLILQGLDVAGTQAAAETLIHPAAILPILQRATRPDGSVRPFEILLRSDSIESRSADAQIIGSRVY
jgi:hypothetical protein